MESRRVIFLTKGYLRGWLDFDYKTPNSRVREEFIINTLEREEMARLLALRAQMDASVAGGLGNVDLFKSAKSSYMSHFELTLPYLDKQSKMESGVISKENIAEWKAMLKELKKSKDNK